MRQQIAAGRRARDRMASIAIGAAGAAVIVLILLILGYLLYVALPLASAGNVARTTSVPLGVDGELHLLSADELWRMPGVPARHGGQVLVTGQYAIYLDSEALQFFELLESAGGSPAADGLPRLATRSATFAISAGGGVSPGSLSVDSNAQRVFLAYTDMAGWLHAGAVRLDSGGEPSLQRWSMQLATPIGRPPHTDTLVDAESGLVLAVYGGQYLRWKPENGSAGASTRGLLPGLDAPIKLVAWGPGRETLQVVDTLDQLYRFDVARPHMPRLGAPRPTGMNVLWLGSESSRRVSYLMADDGELLVLEPSSGEAVVHETVARLAGPGRRGIGVGGAFVYRLTDTEFTRVELNNPYPETGWRSLWLPQWFGAYDQAAQYWHPDGAAIGVLSKLSLSPLLYGTFKAALYGMFLAIPLALGAAIYTGYFLPPRIRNRIKPAIEMLEAFPTVVLGFVAGLWLAPLLVDYLLLIVLLPVLLLGLPVLLALIHWTLQLLSSRFQRRPPRIVLISVVYVLAVALLMVNTRSLEGWLLGGSLRDWLWIEWGIAYEQRNALLVGMAMGVAITPVMFSIVEDSIFAVPRSLSDGSLALGATRWQSLARVVLPAASPAILSALLIGLARGLGETMIVLLATGNTPLMEPGAFSGLRSLSASIVVELPEAGSGSTQFRLLFLAALVLFGLTFVLNTIAELFRQRLRYAHADR